MVGFSTLSKSYHDGGSFFPASEVTQPISILLHVLVVLGHCQANQPQEVYQQEGPVNRYQKQVGKSICWLYVEQ